MLKDNGPDQTQSSQLWAVKFGDKKSPKPTDSVETMGTVGLDCTRLWN